VNALHDPPERVVYKCNNCHSISISVFENSRINIIGILVVAMSCRLPFMLEFSDILIHQNDQRGLKSDETSHYRYDAVFAYGSRVSFIFFFTNGSA
jgi:hypothetical protein